MNYKIKVNGMNITAMSSEKKAISDITEKNKVNYTKKLTDKLKTEKQKLMIFEKLSHGLIP